MIGKTEEKPDVMLVMRVSSDGVFGAVYVPGTKEILIYRFMQPNGDLLPDKLL